LAAATASTCSTFSAARKGGMAASCHRRTGSTAVEKSSAVVPLTKQKRRNERNAAARSFTNEAERPRP
jgi:hypothetical protein